MPLYGSQVPPYGAGVPNISPFGMPTQPMQLGVFGMPTSNTPLPVSSSGQGPLGEVPARMGPNGLYMAPEPEGPEEHGRL
jgi:hypothetical protein